MTEYRYAVSDDGTITRGHLTRIGDEDTWRHYWDGDMMVAFYDEGFRGLRAATEDDDNVRRAMEAHRAESLYGETGALKRAAQRIEENDEADFILVHLDRGTDLYALSYNGQNDGWRDEIEALWNGEVYRIIIEEYTGLDGDEAWEFTDDYPEDFYGIDNAEAALAKHFDLSEFPAERVLTEAGA